MPSFVITEKCDGCKGGDKTACMYICPNFLRQDLPDPGYRGQRLFRLCAVGKFRYADAGYRRCHVDLQVQKRAHQTL